MIKGEEMTRFAVLTFLIFVFTGCATQQMHFAAISPIDFSVPNIAKTFNPRVTYAIRNVSNGGYQNYGEFGNYSWHGFVDGRYQGFRRLPYKDPDATVKNWLTEVLQENELSFSDQPEYVLDVYVEKLKIKTQKDNSYDYRACSVTLRVDLVSMRGDKQVSIVLDGISKLNGSDLVINDSSVRSMNVSFYPDKPQICKLAIASALRNVKL
jgi:hypothetical protein